MEPVDLRLACRMAKACECTYAIGRPGGPAASPSYAAVGFTSPPASIEADGINAALLGPTAEGLLLAFRGSLPLRFDSVPAFLTSLFDWLGDAAAEPTNLPGVPGLVHSGFAAALTSLWPPLTKALDLHGAAGKRLLITGHSKGAVLASVAALKLLGQGITPAAVYTFGSPRGGDEEFAAAYAHAVPAGWRFENRNDIVPHCPPAHAICAAIAALDPRFKTLARWDYHPVGTLAFIDRDGRVLTADAAPSEDRRVVNITEALLRGKIERIGNDHVMGGGYMNDPCVAAPPGSGGPASP